MQKLMEEARAEAEQLGLTREQLGLKQLQDPGIDLGPAVGARGRHFMQDQLFSIY